MNSTEKSFRFPAYRQDSSCAGGCGHRRNDCFSRVHSHPGPTKSPQIGHSDRAIEERKRKQLEDQNRKPRENRKAESEKTGERRVFCPVRGESKNKRRRPSTSLLNSTPEASVPPAHLRPYPLRFAAPSAARLVADDFRQEGPFFVPGHPDPGGIRPRRNPGALLPHRRRGRSAKESLKQLTASGVKNVAAKPNFMLVTTKSASANTKSGSRPTSR